VIKLLEGVRVVECAVLFNGDQTGRILGDLGAEVIKVEAPGVGDYLRDFLGQITPHHSPAHMYANRSKKSMTLNLRTERGRDIFFELLRTADIFVDGFAGSACDRMGIGYDAQCAVKQDIIYCQCSGFGATGPYAEIPTHGQMMGALGGGIELHTRADGLVEEGQGLADGTMVAATNAALTAVAALWQRQQTGQGAKIDVAGSDAVLSTMWLKPIYDWNSARLVDRRGMGSTEGGPNAKYHFYETKDGKYILFCAIEEKFWRNFCVAIERTDLLENIHRDAPVDFVGEGNLAYVLQDIFYERTLADWMDVALSADVAMGPANQRPDLLDDPQLKSRHMILETEHPHAGPFTTIGWPALVRGQPYEVTFPAPLLGEHTEAVLSDLGISEGEINLLRDDGVI
jgi:crotonobetainyl-CoA:carnitine CoA-transferase CaiB-like acyl-CoA transferase